MQNFPNPFNPITKIRYTIAPPNLRLQRNPYGKREDFVQLKIYDILGNEVATLVNETKPAGEYEVEFDGNKLPSGIYYYRLHAGNFSETKKLVLMK